MSNNHKKMPASPNWAARRGAAFHTLLEHTYQHKVQAVAVLNVAEAVSTSSVEQTVERIMAASKTRWGCMSVEVSAQEVVLGEVQAVVTISLDEDDRTLVNRLLSDWRAARKFGIDRAMGPHDSYAEFSHKVLGDVFACVGQEVPESVRSTLRSVFDTAWREFHGR